MTEGQWQASLRDGRHADLARLVGDWSGRLRTTLEAGEAGSEGSVRGSIRALLGGRFVIHDYESTVAGELQQGLAVHGYNLERDRFETAWIDNLHSGTQLLFGSGLPVDSLPAVSGSCAGEGDGETAGWRTEWQMTSRGQLLIRLFKIPAHSEAFLAAEFDYRRVHAVRPL